MLRKIFSPFTEIKYHKPEIAPYLLIALQLVILKILAPYLIPFILVSLCILVEFYFVDNAFMSWKENSERWRKEAGELLKGYKTAVKHLVSSVSLIEQLKGHQFQYRIVDEEKEPPVN